MDGLLHVKKYCASGNIDGKWKSNDWDGKFYEFHFIFTDEILLSECNG